MEGTHFFDMQYSDDVIRTSSLTVHTATRCAPYELVFGRKPEPPIILAELNETALEEKITDHDAYLQILIQQINLKRWKAKTLNLEKFKTAISMMNEGRKAFPFQEGELVMKYMPNGMIGTN